MVKHRHPPKPIHYSNAAPGQCRYCGEMIIAANGKIKTRANWHPHCLETYKTIYWPAHTRKAVWERDQGVCFVCERVCTALRGDGSDWHVDHIRPLYEAQGRIEYWKLSNLQLLCVACHHAKSAIEAGERATARRLSD